MDRTIFCPSNHLILDQAVCPECGWRRPPQVPQGSLLWNPVLFQPGIGGQAQESFFRPGVIKNIAVFPLRSGELAGISREDGKVLWQTEASPELFPRQLYPDGDLLVGVVADNRSLEAAGNGYLGWFDPQTGEMVKSWQGYGYTMSEPAFTEDCLLVRTARPKLVALSRESTPRVLWEVPLKTYKPIRPAAGGGLALAWDGEVNKEQVTLKAFDLHSGKPVWQAAVSEIDCPPLVAGKHFIFRSGKKTLAALDLNNGSPAWERKYTRIYSRPAVDENKIFLVVCNDADVSAPGHYSLTSIDAGTGEVDWIEPLGIRAQEILIQPDGSLLVGMGDPALAICSAQDGNVVWKYSFGEEKINRVQTHLVVQDGVLWSGTYEGRAAAIRVAVAEEGKLDPDQCFQEGDFKGAAAGYAINGNLKKSGEIYLERLNSPRQALVLFERAGHIDGQAAALIKMGDELSAARLYEKDGQTIKAAELYVIAGKQRKAIELYEQAGLMDEARRLRDLVPPDPSDIEELTRQGRFGEAAELALKLKDFRTAYDCFTQANDADKAFDSMIELCAVAPEEWSLVKLADLARSRGLFKIQAWSYEQLDDKQNAAEAYYYAGVQAEKRSPDDHEQIAEYFRKAWECYKQEGLHERQYFCREKFIKYAHLPDIQVSGHSEHAFREGQFNTLILYVKNVGNGRADDVKVRVPGDRFEIEKYSMPEAIERLAANHEKEITIPIRPLKDQVGDGVPFILEWEWKDRTEQIYRDRTTVYVTVKEKSDSKTGGTPITIVAEKYYAGGDHHQEFGGDNIQAGAQKGDRVEIRHGESARVFDSELGEITGRALVRFCPNCDLPVEADAEYCDACGAKLAPKGKKNV